MSRVAGILFTSILFLLFLPLVSAQPALTVNELLPNPAGKDTEGEFIELKNAGSAPIKLAGYKLRDVSQKSKGKAYTIPSGSIAPGGYIVLPYSQTKISLNNDGDTIELLNPSGAVLSEVRYGKAPEGKSWSFDGSSYRWNAPSPGGENQFVSPTAATKPEEASTPIEITQTSRQETGGPYKSKALGWSLITASGLAAFGAVSLPGNKKLRRLGKRFAGGDRKPASNGELGE